MLHPPLRIGIDINDTVSEINATLTTLTLLSNCLGTLRDLEQYASEPFQKHKSVESIPTYDDSSIADELVKKVRVLCWVMTYANNHKKRARHVKATWGKRCTKLLFMSTTEDPDLPAIKLPVPEEYDLLWGKTKEAFKYVYKHHRNDADWFLKADDDTYVVVENLRYILSKHNSRDAIYFGCRFKPYSKEGYMSGGAGYVLSREALDRFVNIGLTQELCEPADTGSEDVNMGHCLQSVGVKAMDTRDRFGQGRFFPFTPQEHLLHTKNPNYWYWQYIYYPINEGIDCCSSTAVSFHYIEPRQMYEYEYLIYKLRPYGIRYGENAKTAGNFKPLTNISSNKPTGKTEDGNETKLKTLCSNKTTVKTVGTNETQEKTVDNNKTKVKILDINKTTRKTVGTNETQEKILDSNKTKVKTSGINKTMVKTPGTNETQEKTVDNNKTKVKVLGINKTTVKTVGTNESQEKAVDNNKTKVKILDISKTTVKTVGTNESQEKTLDNNITKVKTLGKNETKVKTIYTNIAKEKNADNNKSKEKTVGYSKIKTKILDNNKIKGKSVSTNKTTRKTVDSHESKEKSVDSNDIMTKTVNSNKCKTKSVGSNDIMAKTEKSDKGLFRLAFSCRT